MDKLKRKVPILNIFYMLSYVWDKTEKFGELLIDNLNNFSAPDLLATLFLMSTTEYVRFGLYQEYQTINEEIKGVKGKVDFKNSLTHLSFRNAKAYCSYDILEINNSINQVIKSTAVMLYRMELISVNLKVDLNNFLLYFNGIDLIDLSEKSFEFEFNSKNHYCYPLIKICHLIYQVSMISEEAGQFKFVDVFDDDDKMESLFELFAYRFYLKEYSNSRSRTVKYQSKLEWLAGGEKVDMQWLPGMYIDIKVENEDTVFIIDTKYYTKFYAEQKFGFGDNQTISKKLNSSNMYQVFSYMNQCETDKNIRGVLLYPMPYSLEEINAIYKIKTITKNGTKDSTLQIKTIDLSSDWNTIRDEMLSILN